MMVDIFKMDDAVVIPGYETSGAAAVDFKAFIPQSITLQPKQRVLIGTGLKMAIPHGLELQIRPRSGLALKNGITVLNSPGTIDSDYRGEIGIVLYNSSDEPFLIRNGDRVAQGVFAPVSQVSFSHSLELPETDRGEGGFGSTGVE